MSGLHDHPGIFPTLPPRMPSMAGEIDRYAPEGDPWRECWEYVLSHDLTDGEGATFWTGAHLASARLTAERDRARDIAVALEQENARLEEENAALQRALNGEVKWTEIGDLDA